MRTMNIQRADDPTEAARLADQGHYAATNRAEAEDLAPWAAVVVDVEGGWLAFESPDDAETWERQQ